MIQKFDVIVADCPWSFSDKLRMSDVPRGAQANYSTMTISKIKQLPVAPLCAEDGAVLCLWVPGSLLQQGLDVMKAWGFQHKQTYVWVKNKKDVFSSLRKDIRKGAIGALKIFRDISNRDTKSCLKSFSAALASKTRIFNLNYVLAFGMGRLFRQTHEICLIGINNNKIYKKLANKSQRSVSFGENLKHSAKPEHLQNSLELMFPNCNYLELFARRLRPNWTCLGNEIDGKDIFDAIAEL